MKQLAGFTQEKLNDIWDSLDGDNPDPSAKKMVDDDIEQVMTISTSDGQVSVSRKPREEWFATPSVGDSSFV